MNLKEQTVFGIIITLNMKVMVIKNSNVSLDEYLNTIIDLQNPGTCKSQLTIANNFISPKDIEEERVMHSNSDNIKSHPDRVSKIKSFISKYTCDRKHYPSKKDDWKRFEKNNSTIALIILYIRENEIPPVYISKHNSTHEKQIILLIISNEKKKYGIIL